MKLTFLFLLLTVSMDAQTKKKPAAPKPAPKVIESYDPDKLGPGEVACGRLNSVKSPPCTCMKHRAEEADKQRERCYGIVDRQERIACAQAANPCAVKVIDAESANSYEFEDGGTPMPVQCKRTCRKARCECCHS